MDFNYSAKDIVLILVCFACFLAALVLGAPKASGEDALPATVASTFDLDSLGVDSRLLPGVPALTQYQNEVAKAKLSYEASIYKAAEELRKKLAAAQEQATKAGDLDKALAIRAAMDKLPKAPKAVPPKPVSMSKDVVLYAQPGFKGPGTIVRQFEVIIDAHAIDFPNDGLRSIKIPAGYTVEVYQNELGGGGMFLITEETADLAGTPALGMSSFLIHRPK